MSQNQVSLGLVTAPRIRFLQKSQKQRQQNPDQEDESDEEEEEVTTNKEVNAKDSSNVKKIQIKIQNTPKKLIRRLPAETPLNFNGEDDEDAENDSLFTVKSVFNPKLNKQNEENNDQDDDDLILSKKIKIKTKASVAKKLKKMNIKVNEKVQFDDEGNRIFTSINQPRSINITDQLADELNKKNDETENLYSGINIEEAKQMLKNEDQYDKQLYRQRIKRIHKEKKLKEKNIRRAKRARGDGDDEESFADEDNVGVRLKTESDDSEED